MTTKLGWAGAVLWAGLGLAAQASAQVAVTGELAVSEPGHGPAVDDPAIGLFLDGSALVTWREWWQSSYEVPARILSATPGQAPFPLLVAEAGNATAESYLQVSCSDRRLACRIVWQAFDGARFAVHSRAFSPQADPLSSELIVRGADNDAVGPALGVSGTSRWTLGWESLSREFINSVNSFAQVFDGNQPVAPPVALNTPVENGTFGPPFIAASPLGDSVLVLNEALDGETYGDVWARTFSRDGRTLGPRVRVAREGARYVDLCGVGMDAEGRFAVAWSQGDSIPEGASNVYARRFGADGTPLGEPFLVPTENAFVQYDCDLAMNREGDFAVVWQHYDGTDENHDDLYLRAYHADGSPYGNPVRVDAPRDRNIYWIAYDPDIAINDAGIIGVTWRGGLETGPGDVYARRFVLPCVDSATSLCLGHGRYRVRAEWWIGESATGNAHAMSLRADTGAFWFFTPDNPELVVKVLDGCPVNQQHWIYAAGLTDVEARVTVTDTVTGEVWSRTSPFGEPFAPIQDIEALAGCGQVASTPLREVGPGFSNPGSNPRSEQQAAQPLFAEPRSACVFGPTALCLSGGRFEVAATFGSLPGESLPAIGVPLTDASGLFWFYSPDNLELVVKLLDACRDFDQFWLFAAGLTDREVHLRVRDTWTDRQRTYSNPLGGAFQLVRDTSTFQGCH